MTVLALSALLFIAFLIWLITASALFAAVRRLIFGPPRLPKDQIGARRRE